MTTKKSFTIPLNARGHFEVFETSGDTVRDNLIAAAPELLAACKDALVVAPPNTWLADALKHAIDKAQGK